MKAYIAFTIMIFASFIIVSIVHTHLHENVHKAIGVNHGADCEIHYKIISNSYTQCKYVNVSDEVKLQASYLNMQNEIIGYNVISIIGTMFILLITFVFYLNFKN